MALRTPTRHPVIARALGIVAAAALSLLAAVVPAAAFHDGGVASCERCHVMHEAVPGQIALDGSNPLLLAASSTDLCLVCHGDGGVMGTNPLLPPRELGAGNFVFLLEDDLNDARGQAAPRIDGEAAGHSIVAPARGLAADSRWTRAPGGTFPSSALGCTSCHDPHGNGTFRMLRGVGPVQGGVGNFIHPAPVATGLAPTDAAATESAASHTAYVSGMTAWCANCHGAYHAEGGDGFAHPVDLTLGAAMRRRYESYAGDANPAGGDPSASYLPEVPFESASATPGATAGPGPADRLHCLTCHRAHASSAPAAGRWDFAKFRLARDGQPSGSWPIPSPYPDPDQGQLCRKCHEVGHDEGRACIECHRDLTPGPTPID
jgi:hypothetical protein